jgi:transposase
VDLRWWEDLLVAMGFRPVQRDQEFLLPPNMTDWLGADHVVWFLIEVIERMDLTALFERAAKRRDGQRARSTAGRAAYDPQMLLILLIYGYACGERSSRQIERLCHTDVAFRLICAGDIPDHTVIARFRQHHAAAFAELFAQVLLLCREAGLVKLCTVAIDGSKIAANASKQANRSEEWLRTEAEKATTQKTSAQKARAAQDGAAQDGAAQDGAAQDGAAQDGGGEPGFEGVVGQIVAEAEQVDAAEDAVFGPARGDEMPPGWGRRGAERAARINAALARITAAEQARQAERAERTAEQARRDTEALAAAEQALQQVIATREAAEHAWEAAWEHAVRHPGAPVPHGGAPVPAEQSAQVRHARERVAKARARVEHPDTAPRRGRPPTPKPGPTPDKAPLANTTDPDSGIMPTRNGWVQGYNNQFAISSDQIIIATHVSTNPADILSYHHMVTATRDAADLLHATDELGTLLFDAGYASTATLTAPGPDRLIALGKTHTVHTAAREHPTTGPPPPDSTPREAMDHRLRTPDGAALYKRRGATVEPGIGNFKKLLNRYSRRGLAAATSETDLTAAVFNLLKIHRATTT